MSSAPAHRVAAFDWQLQHPDELYRLGLLRAHDGKIDIADRDVDDAMAEIAVCYLEGRLSPADAEAELALQDLMERLNREIEAELGIFRRQ